MTFTLDAQVAVVLAAAIQRGRDMRVGVSAVPPVVARLSLR
jgi:hypothetical protein